MPAGGRRRRPRGEALERLQGGASAVAVAGEDGGVTGWVRLREVLSVLPGPRADV